MISFDQAVKNLLEFSTVISPNELRNCFDVESISSGKPLSPLICERCGGTIDRQSMICPYCDTKYENRATHKARETFFEKIYLTHKEIYDIQRTNPFYNFKTLDDTVFPIYRGKEVVPIEDKKLANMIDTYNGEIQRLQQQAANLEDVGLLREVGWKINVIRDTIESLKKLYKEKQENFEL